MAKIIIKSKSGWIKIKLKGSKFRNFLDKIGEIAPVFNEAIQNHLRPQAVRPCDEHFDINQMTYPGCSGKEGCTGEVAHYPLCPRHPFNVARNADRA